MPHPQLKKTKSLAESDLQELASRVGDTEIPPIFVKKLKNVFLFFDQGNSGTYNMAGMQLFISKFKQYGGLTEEETAEMKQFFCDWCLEIIQHPDAKLSQEDYIKICYVMATTPELRPDYEDRLQYAYSRFFRFLDTNHDGIISRQEWRIFYKCLGIHEEKIADASFDAIDLNKNNEMSLEEFVTGVKEFAFSLEHGRYDTFFGPV